MATDRDGLDPEGVGDRLEGLDPGTVRERLDAFYVRYFMPPSVKRDVEAETPTRPETDAEAVSYAGFDFGAWRQEGRESGPRTPPSEPRVVTEAAESAPAAPAAEYEGFAFAEWLDDGESFEPVDAGRRADEPAVETGAASPAAGEEEFAFTEWLADGEEYEPIEVGESADEAAADEPAERPLDEPFGVPRETPAAPAASAGLHPAKAATFALFIAVAVLTVLSIVGYLPPLGPDVGLAG